jgi:hypothetical protein
MPDKKRLTRAISLSSQLFPLLYAISHNIANHGDDDVGVDSEGRDGGFLTRQEDEEGVGVLLLLLLAPGWAPFFRMVGTSCVALVFLLLSNRPAS